MKNNSLFKVFICLFVLVLALSVLASCAKDKKDDKAVVDSSDKLDNLPDDLDYKGETVNFFYWGSSFVEWELTSDGTTGDIVDKSINERNNTVESRLNINLNYIKGETPAEVFMPTVRDEIMSGSTDYDIIVGVQCEAGPVAAGGAFLDLKDSKYLDLSADYWNDDYNEALSVNDKRYMVGGDISLTTTAWASTMFFDINGFQNIFGDVDEFYQFVYDGNWTLDEFSNRCKQCYQDLNGNGQKDVSDQYGLGIMGTGSVTDQFLFSSGVTYSTRDENNVPVLNMKNDKTIEFVEKFYDTVYNNEGVYPITAENASYSEDLNTVFGAGLMNGVIENRGEEDDFGIIPMPKLNSSETQYHSWISDCTVVYSVPVTLDESRAEMSGAVLECMASETSRLCLPQYYERALKSKYVRDSWSAKMLDLIHDGETTDFVSVYSLSLGEIGTIMRQLIGYQEPNFVSNYDSKAPMVESKLAELLATFDQKFETETVETVSSEEVDSLEIADNQISSGWAVLGTKYKKSGVWVKEDMSEHFAYVVNSNDEIEVRSPDIKVCGGYYPTAAIVSRETLPLNDLSVSFHVDEGFTYTTEGWASSFSVMWTDTMVTELSYYLEGPGTNGLREIPSEDTKGVSIHFMGSSETSGNISNLLYIVLYDGEGSRPEIDNRLGYRFTNWVDHDVSQPTTVEIKEDDALGYVVSVNGVEYRTGTRGDTSYDIDLNLLKDVDAGHLTIGAEANDANFCNFTVSTINGKPAGTFFD